MPRLQAKLLIPFHKFFDQSQLSGRKTEVRSSADVFLLDDAFQHLQLHRDLDVVVDNPKASFLREGRRALQYADLVIPRKLRPAIPDSLRGKRVLAFAGLADNRVGCYAKLAAGRLPVCRSD